MKRVLVISAMTLMALVLVVGGGVAYYFMGMQDRGMTKDGHMAPPASVRNAPEAPKFDSCTQNSAAKTANQSPDVQLPTEFKLPTELDIQSPTVPEGLAQPADAGKS